MKWSQVFAIAAVILVAVLGFAILADDDPSVGQQLEEGVEEVGDEIDDAT